MTDLDQRTKWRAEKYSQAWQAAADERLRLQVHTVAAAHEVVGLHVGYVAGSSPAFSVTLTAADAATLAGVLRDAANAAVRNIEEA